MNKKIRDMYQGKNFIYESLSSSLNEEKATGEAARKVAAMDSISSLSNILNTLFTIILNSKNEGMKTERGFSEVKNKMGSIINFGAFRQYVISLIESLSNLDPAQKQAFDENIQYLLSLFRSIETQMSDEKIFLSAQENIIKKMLGDFESDLAERERQMKETKPSLYNELKKEGEIVERRRTGDETDPAEAEFRGKAFNKSKESLDAATAFVGMIDRDKYTPALKDHAEIKRYKEVADGLYKKAQDSQMVDRRGLKIITPMGEVKRDDFMRDQDNLINEIIRQKKEYTRIKNGILKENGLTPPPPVPVVCPPGKVYDKGKGICVSLKQENDNEIKPPPPVQTECKFPVRLNTKCNDVGTLQTKLMDLLPNTVKDYLTKKGGADKVYGKGTALICNAIWAQIKKLTGRSPEDELTKEMYDELMALTSSDIQLFAPTLDSANYMSFGDKLEEMEGIKESVLLSFDDYLSLLNESESLDEQVFDRLKEARPKKKEEKKEETEKGSETSSSNSTSTSTYKVKEECIKNSIESGNIDACISDPTPPTPPTPEECPEGKVYDKEKGTCVDKKEEEEEVIEWQGLKPVNDGAYTIYYDESWGDWWGDVAKYALVSGIVVGAVIMTSGGALAVAPAVAGAEGAIATVAAGAAAFGSGALAAGAGLASTTGAITLAVGAIGGSTISKWAGDDRKPVTVIVFNGYMEEDAVYAMARGLHNSLGGTVSSQDVLAIMSTLIMCRGTYMNNGSDKAVAVWPALRNRFAQLAGEDIGASINDIVSGGVGGWFKDWWTDMDPIPSMPRFTTKDPTGGAPAEFENAVDSLKSAVRKLDANVSKMSQNVSNITAEDLQVLADAMDEITVTVADAIEEE